MARGSTLKQVRRILRGHMGIVVDEGYNTADDSMHNQLIASKQTVLATRFQWPFLKDRWDIMISAGVRYSLLPTVTIRNVPGPINTDNEVTAVVQYNTRWKDVDFLIGEEDYNVLDPDQDERMDPIEKWQFIGFNQFEVWPLPADQQKLRFDGWRVPMEPVSDSDRLELDDELIALYIAAELLAKQEAKDAQPKMREAEYRLNELRGAVSAGEPPTLMGYNPKRWQRPRIVPIAVAGNKPSNFP